jgi:hypothetical protein
VTLAIEYRRGAWWLVVMDTPASKPSALALFTDEDAAYVFKAAMARSMCFAREMGRQAI